MGRSITNHEPRSGDDPGQASRRAGPVAATLASPPFLAAWAARIIRCLPTGRERMADAFYRRYRTPPFAATVPGSAAGLRYECNLRNGICRWLFLTGRYEPAEILLVRELLGPGQVFVDVGAHWGYFSLVAAERVGPSGRVVAIEADPEMYGALTRSLDLNALDGITAVHVAAAAESGVLPFLESRQVELCGGSRLARDDEPQSILVDARPIDSLLDDLGIDRVDLLKMDIEGGEAMALRGMRDGLSAGRYRRVLIEMHPAQIRRFGASVEELFALLGDSGYRAERVLHAPAALRRANRDGGPGALLEPFDPSSPLGAWPHLLWTAPPER